MIEWLMGYAGYFVIGLACALVGFRLGERAAYRNMAKNVMGKLEDDNG